MQKFNQIQENINLKNYTTIKVGGISNYFAEPSNIEEFINLLKWAKSKNCQCLILGAGSNTLIKNINIKKLTICTRNMNKVKIEPKTGLIYAQSGVLLPKLSTLLAQNHFTGGEWTIGIPGTIGGAIYMNAGAGKYSISDNLKSVKVIDPDTLNTFVLSKNEINFEYRFSSFQLSQLIILEAKFYFWKKGNKEKILEKTKSIISQRKKQQPYHLPSCGSVFKNPISNFAGKLIEESGLKGVSIGGAEISTMHANFIVNKNSASSEDVFSLIILIQKKVLQKTGILLHPEVRMIGFDYP